MKYIVTPEEMKQADYDTVIKLRVTERQLMEVAGKECFNIIQSKFPDYQSKKFLVISGKGNNGGDGIVLARYLAAHNVSLDLVCLASEGELRQENIQNLKSLRQFMGLNSNLRIFEADEVIPDIIKNQKYDFIIDAILGTGYKKSEHPEGIKRTEPNNPFLPRISESELAASTTSIIALPVNPKQTLINNAILLVNHHRSINNSIVIAIDLPSGLNGKNGTAQPNTVTADLTITLGYPKTGFFFSDGLKHTGEIVCADIGIPQVLLPKKTAKWVDEEYVKTIRPKRDRNANKTTGGKVLIIAGHQEETASQIGAAVLSTLGAVHSGASYVCVSTSASSFNVFHTHAPESILIEQSLELILEKVLWADSIVIGPGFGRSANRVKAMTNLLKHLFSENLQPTPIILDGDALYAISELGLLKEMRFTNAIFTPHHGEFSKLIGKSSIEIEYNKLELAQSFVAKHKTNLLLKGPTTLVASEEETFFVTNGNETLATAGTGDILSGMIGSFAAQGCTLLNAGVEASFNLGAISILISVKEQYPSSFSIVQSLKAYRG